MDTSNWIETENSIFALFVFLCFNKNYISNKELKTLIQSFGEEVNITDSQIMPGDINIYSKFCDKHNIVEVKTGAQSCDSNISTDISSYRKNENLSFILFSNSKYINDSTYSIDEWDFDSEIKKLETNNFSPDLIGYFKSIRTLKVKKLKKGKINFMEIVNEIEEASNQSIFEYIMVAKIFKKMIETLLNEGVIVGKQPHQIYEINDEEFKLMLEKTKKDEFTLNKESMNTIREFKHNLEIQKLLNDILPGNVHSQLRSKIISQIYILLRENILKGVTEDIIFDMITSKFQEIDRDIARKISERMVS